MSDERPLEALDEDVTILGIEIDYTYVRHEETGGILALDLKSRRDNYAPDEARFEQRRILAGLVGRGYSQVVESSAPGEAWVGSDIQGPITLHYRLDPTNKMRQDSGARPPQPEMGESARPRILTLCLIGAIVAAIAIAIAVTAGVRVWNRPNYGAGYDFNGKLVTGPNNLDLTSGPGVCGTLGTMKIVDDKGRQIGAGTIFSPGSPGLDGCTQIFLASARSGAKSYGIEVDGQTVWLTPAETRSEPTVTFS